MMIDTYMTIDQVIALGASICGFMSAIAAFLAVRQASQQREFSYRPELVLAKTKFEGTLIGMKAHWAKEGEEKELIKLFSIPLVNIGLGSAKGVKVSWQFQIEKFVNVINSLAQKSLISVFYEYENEILSLKSNGLGGFSSFWVNQQEQMIDFVLSEYLHQVPVELIIPSAYIEIVTAFIYFSRKSGEYQSFSEMRRYH